MIVNTYDQRLLQWSQGAFSRRWSLMFIGHWLTFIGAGLLISGMFFTPPWVKAGIFTGIAGILLSRPPILRHPLMWVGIAFSFWIILGVAANFFDHRPGADRLPGAAYTWVAMPVVACAALNPLWRVWAIRLAILCGCGAVVVSFLQFFIGYGVNSFLTIDPNGPKYWIAKGFSSYYLSYGFVSGLLLLLCTLPNGSVPLGAVWTWVGRVAAITGAVLCGSRSAALAFMAAMGAVLGSRGSRYFFWGGIGALVMGALIFGRIAATDPTQKMQRMLSGNEGRFEIWKYSIQIIQDNPVFGVGSKDAYIDEYNKKYLVDHSPTDGLYAQAHAHNWMLTAASYFGIPTGILHFSLVTGVVVFCWRRRKVALPAFCLATGTVTLALVGGMFEPFPLLAVSGLAFHGVLGLAMGLAIAPGAEGIKQIQGEACVSGSPTTGGA